MMKQIRKPKTRQVAAGPTLIGAPGTTGVFRLNQTASQVWHLLQKGHSEDQIIRQLIRQYPDAAPLTIRRDITVLLKDLTQKKLWIKK